METKAQTIEPEKVSEIPRLLPLVEGTPNEGLANALARLFAQSIDDAEAASTMALVILTGIQEFYDSGGDYVRVEQVWEPIIVYRQLEKAFGDNAQQKATELYQSAKLLNDTRGAAIYKTVSEFFSNSKQSS